MDLLEKAARSGVNPTFIDGNGQIHEADPQALQSVIDALGSPAASRIFDGPYVARANGGAPSLDLSGVLSQLSSLELQDERGAVLGKSGAAHGQLDIASGLYRLRAMDVAGASDDATLVVAPEKAFSGNFGRRWLLAVQLYGVRSRRNWGIGDFTDLQVLLRWAERAGAAGVGLNPLHVLFDDHPQDCSPYSPNSRLFLNANYIDVEKLPELPLDFVTEHKAEIDRLRQAELVDYAAIADLKDRALRLAFKNFKAKTTLKRKADFDAFCANSAPQLSRFAYFEILRRKCCGPWWDWPKSWSRPDDAALATLRHGEDALEIEYIEFVQWCADRQLAACTELATQLGMPVGLYLDVAVGVKADGFDAWNEQAAIARQLSVGAPPDQLNSGGQDWGLAGYNASGLEHRAFIPFRDMLRASMRYAGAIRLDHVLGLNRLYVVPHGYAPHQGVYIQMPFEAMLAVVALESVAHRCIVIGEDLGTVPDGFRERLADWAIWSYRVMIFERGAAGDFISADHYPENALVTFNTHDLPTFSGWRSAHDIGVKRALGIDPGETEEVRQHALARLCDAVGGGGSDIAFESVLEFLSRAPSRLLGVSIEDLLGVADQANVPGTIEEHPNWRRRLPYPIETWDQHIDLHKLRVVLKGRII
ncbi:MAG: 4-alpha-glucanotransferase [Xanthobacteraceae bacterium]|nr:4-alpha-glucanotransferase [Xanthobacteraceae bacterium]